MQFFRQKVAKLYPNEFDKKRETVSEMSWSEKFDYFCKRNIVLVFGAFEDRRLFIYIDEAWREWRKDQHVVSSRERNKRRSIRWEEEEKKKRFPWNEAHLGWRV